MVHDVAFADCEGDNFLTDLTKIWTLQIADHVDAPTIVYADQKGYPPIAEGLEKLKGFKKVVFHNAWGYDFWAINKIYPDTLKQEQMVDSLVLSRLMNSKASRHNLHDIGEALGYPKGDFSDFSQFSEEMAVYGKQDVEILKRAWKGLHRNGKTRLRSWGKFYDTFNKAFETENYTAYVISKQEQFGFNFNVEKATLLEAELRTESLQLERKLTELFPPIVYERWSEKTGKRLKDGVDVFNPASRDQIGKRLIDKYGWKPEVKTKTGRPKIDETTLGELDFPEAIAFARYLKLGKMLGMLADGKNAWLKMYRENADGTFTMHGQVNTLGARTHRMSHFKPNVAQADSDPRMRGCFEPRPHHVQLGLDAEGLELRMLAHYLAKFDDGAYAKAVHGGDKKKGTDVHSMNMRAAELYLRDSAKTTIYAHNYGCFDKKLGLIAIEDARTAGKPIPQGSPTAIGAVIREKLQAGIIGLGELIAMCERAHYNRESLPRLDGARIPSASAHSALNTLLQGNGSLVMKVALNEFDREMGKLQLWDKFGYCANVHDEFQLSVDPDYLDKTKEVGLWSFERAGEVLGIRCPIIGDAQVGQNWAECH